MIEECSVSGRGHASGLELPRSPLIRSTARRPRLAISEVTTYRWSLLEDVIGLQETGIDAIGLWRTKVLDFGEERAVELLRDSGLAVSSLAWAGGFTGACGHSFADAVEDTREAIGLAGRLGAKCLVLVSGPRAGHTGNHARRIVVEALRHLADEAAQAGVTLGLEPMHRRFAHDWTFLTAIDQTLDVLNRCDHPAVGMVFDSRHLREEPRVLERIPEIAPHVTAVQLNDCRDDSSTENDGCLPGDGAVPLAEITRAFLNSGYGGFFEIELWSDDLWNSDYFELLETCRSRFGSLCGL